MFGGAIFWLSLSIPIGILSALRPRSIMDRFSMTFVFIGRSGVAPGSRNRPAPLLIIFGSTGLTPIAGYSQFFPGTVGRNAAARGQLAYT